NTFEYTATSATLLGSNTLNVNVFRDSNGSFGYEVVYRDAAFQTHLFQYDSTGATLLANGVVFATKAFSPLGGFVFDVVYANGNSFQYTLAGGFQLTSF